MLYIQEPFHCLLSIRRNIQLFIDMSLHNESCLVSQSFRDARAHVNRISNVNRILTHCGHLENVNKCGSGGGKSAG